MCREFVLNKVDFLMTKTYCEWHELTLGTRMIAFVWVCSSELSPPIMTKQNLSSQPDYLTENCTLNIFYKFTV